MRCFTFIFLPASDVLNQGLNYRFVEHFGLDQMLFKCLGAVCNDQYHVGQCGSQGYSAVIGIRRPVSVAFTTD